MVVRIFLRVPTKQTNVKTLGSTISKAKRCLNLRKQYQKLLQKLINYDSKYKLKNIKEPVTVVVLRIYKNNLAYNRRVHKNVNPLDNYFCV